jgi:DNA-binding transcriptional MocR family regulator
VIVDDPCYFNFHALLRAHRVKVVSVPFTPNGPDLVQFEQALKEHRPRLYITNSALHNPTGATLSPVVAHRVLKLSEQYDLTIIEDDIFADLEPEPAPRYAAFDGLDRVVHIGSFSKTLSASIRCGYIIARPEWIDGLVDLRIATSFGAGHFSAELVLSVLKDGGYRKHIEALRTRLAGVMSTTTTQLTNLGFKPWIEPRGGMFLWCELPEGVDATDLAQRALAQNVVLAPGSVFSLCKSANRFMRFNAAQAQDVRIFQILTELL